MSKRLLALSIVAIFIVAGRDGAGAQSFYQGKTLRLIVGFAPGGGSTPTRGCSRATWAGTFPAVRRSSSRT